MVMSNRRGGVAIEFALILPVFTALIFGGIDLMWLMLQKHSLQDAVSAGCKAGSMSMVDIYTDPYVIAEEKMKGAMDLNGMVSCPASSCVVTAHASDLTTDTVPWMDCGVTIPAVQLTGIVPGMPDTLSYTVSWPIEIPELDDHAPPG
tara:strand:+ start:1947 stop:2390 length:444 start_codon:yes stop_codon:yes gene_type:complete